MLMIMRMMVMMIPLVLLLPLYYCSYSFAAAADDYEGMIVRIGIFPHIFWSFESEAGLSKSEAAENKNQRKEVSLT